MATIGFSKVFILDKYFTELQKFWETEKKLQGMQIQGKYYTIRNKILSCKKCFSYKTIFDMTCHSFSIFRLP